MKLMVFLQNAYGVEDGYVPDYSKSSFSSCHTGRRLKEMIPDGVDLIIRNANPLVGKKSSAYFPPAPDYMWEQIVANKPTHLLICGKSAMFGFFDIMERHEIPDFIRRVVYAPHPSYRALSKDITKRTKEYLLEGEE